MTATGGLVVLSVVALVAIGGAWAFGVLMKRQRERAFAEDPLLAHLEADVASPAPSVPMPATVSDSVRETLDRLDAALAEGRIDAAQHALLREAALDDRPDGA